MTEYNEKTLTKAAFALKAKAAVAHYNDVFEIRMTEDEFTVAFLAGELQGAKSTMELGKPVDWYYFGLKVVRKEMTSRGN